MEECDVRLVWRRTAGIEERLACHPLKYLPKMPDIAPKPILKRRREIPDSCSDFMSPVNVDGCKCFHRASEAVFLFTLCTLMNKSCYKVC